MGFGLGKKLKARVWPDGNVKYTLQVSGSGKAITKPMETLLEKAMRHWEKAVGKGLKFQEVTDLENDVVRIELTTGSTMWSSGDSLIGMNPKADPVKNARDHRLCFKDGSAYDSYLHEIGHMLGLAHEHDRKDGAAYRKDKLKTVKFVEETAKGALEKGYEPYGDFDEDSIMIYAATNTTGPSSGDIATIKALYGIK